MVMVADQLRKLGGMLWDIRIPREVLEAVCEMHLEVAETISGHLVMSNGCWMLHDLWQWAADRVWDLHIYANVREVANTARRLTSIS